MQKFRSYTIIRNNVKFCSDLTWEQAMKICQIGDKILTFKEGFLHSTKEVIESEVEDGTVDFYNNRSLTIHFK